MVLLTPDSSIINSDKPLCGTKDVTVCSEFKDFYGSGNLSNWIHSEREGISEFDQLIGHANNIGINSLWLFIGTDGNAGNVDEFSFSGWKSGWLRRFDRKYVYEYRCSYPDPCHCDPTLSDGWYV